MPAATAAPTPLVELAMSAPSATAGQRRGPSNRSAASEIPLGAHTGVITPCATERLIPNLALATYALVTPASPSQ
jgi:hypothetical protein